MPKDDAQFMRECIGLARQAMEQGDPPFGAVLVHGGRIVAGDHNRTASQDNFMRHAELNILRDALEKFGPGIFPECVLYSSNEPCPMCAGAIYWSGVRRIVYGMSGKTLMDIRGWGLHASGRDVLEQGTDTVTVVAGVLAEEIGKLHRAFWKR